MSFSILLKLILYSLHRSMWNEANIQKLQVAKWLKSLCEFGLFITQEGFLSILVLVDQRQAGVVCYFIKDGELGWGAPGFFFQALQVAIVVILHLSSLFQPVICICPQIVFHFAEMTGLLLTWL